MSRSDPNGERSTPDLSEVVDAGRPSDPSAEIRAASNGPPDAPGSNHAGQENPPVSVPSDRNSTDHAAPPASEEHGLVAVPAEPLSPAEEIEAFRRERDQLKEQLLRRRADFENYRKRAERDRHQAATDAEAAVFRDLIPTLDNLDRALESLANERSLRDGVELIRRDLFNLLESHGVVAHHPQGQPFDPNRDQALSYEETMGFSDGTVVEVYRKGYFFHDRLLRPALVKVAKAPEGEQGQDSERFH